MLGPPTGVSDRIVIILWDMAQPPAPPRPVVLIGLLGTKLDRGSGAARWGRLAAVGRRRSPRRPRARALRPPSRPPVRAPRQADQEGRRDGVARHRGAHAPGVVRGSVGLRRGVREPALVGRRLPLRRGARGLPRAHDDGVARPADLPLPPDRDAPPAGAPDSIVAAHHAPRSGGRRRPGLVRDHRPRPLAVRRAGGALRVRTARGRLVPEGRHRYPQRRLQRPHGPDRGGRPGLGRADPAHRRDRRRQDAARASRVHELKHRNRQVQRRRSSR